MIQISAVDLFPDNQIYGVNKGPTWILPAPDGSHVGPMNLVIWVYLLPVKAGVSGSCSEESLLTSERKIAA